MTTSFRLPDLGEGVHEAEILAVAVQPGQAVKEGDTILEVETDKAAVEIPSPFTGTVEKINVKPGDVVKVGDELIIFAAPASATSAEKQQPPPVAPQPPHVEVPPPQGSRQGKPVPASPATRKLAHELGVRLEEVTPSGGNGVVTAADVRRHAEGAPGEAGPIREPEGDAQAAPPSREESKPAPAQTAEVDELPDFSRWGDIERRPFRSIRRATAQQMSLSWARIPHVTCQDVADITRLEQFRREHKDDIASAGGHLTVTVFALKAVAAALKQFPQFNASLDMAAGELIIKKYYHIGIAVDTEHGLMVPVIRDVDRKSILELSIELKVAIDRAKTRKSSREEMSGGSFTISNAGAVGGGFFTAIINYPETAILGFGQGRRQPAVITNRNGREEIVPRLLMPVVLCFDHRVADGADAIRFQRMVIDALEDPDRLLMTMT